MSRIKKALDKEKRREFNNYRAKLNEVQRNYDKLQDHESFTEINNYLDEIGVPYRPTDKTPLEELEKINDIVLNIDVKIYDFITNEIENNTSRFLNKMSDYFVDQHSHEKFNRLKELAKNDLNKFAEIEDQFKYYLEDKEVYEYLFYDDNSDKDIQEGILNVMDQVLIDLGVNVSEMENKQNKRWQLNYND